MEVWIIILIDNTYKEIIEKKKKRSYVLIGPESGLDKVEEGVE